VTSPQPEPPLMAALSQAPAATAPQLEVDDYLAPRVRIPADLLRCAIAGIEVALLVGLALVSHETTHGVQITAVGASHFLPSVLLPIVSIAAHAALLILPVGLAIRLLVHRQPRRLTEAVLAGGIAVAVVAVANAVLRQHFAVQLYQALIIRQSSGPQAASSVAALDGLLAGLAAYITVIGLGGRPRWRTGFWLAIGFYGLVGLASSQTTVLALLIALLLGSVLGSGLRYVSGSASERPPATEVAAALAAAGVPVVSMRRVWDARAETRRYAATGRDGSQLDVTVFDRDQQAAGALYRIYRRVRLKAQVSRIAPLTVERAVERRALLTYATQDAGVPTPQLRAVARVGPEAAVLANDHHDGVTLAGLTGPPTEDQLVRVWDTVMALHAHRVTHRTLTADRIMFSNGQYSGPSPDGSASPDSSVSPDSSASPDGSAIPDGGASQRLQAGQVMLLDPGNGDVAASDLQLRLDLTQLMAEIALIAGPDRAAALAIEKVSQAELKAMVPLLQPVALRRSTRAALRRRKDVLPALRKRLLTAVPDGEAAPVQLERIRPRTLVTLVAGLIAAYVLVGQLIRVHMRTVFAGADWRWIMVGLVLSAATYVGAAWSVSGFVLERLRLTRTFMAQVAGSFVTLVTPAAVGGVALNLRYLRRSGVAPADAAASVGVSQLFALGLHLVLLVIFATIAGASQAHSLHPPDWLYIALAALAAGVLVLLAIPVGRRLIRSRLGPALGQVIPRLLDLAQRPAKLAEGIGGALLLTLAYILALDASIRAVGAAVPLASVAVVYLTGSAIGSAVPTPGGIGAVEATLSAGLTAAGLPGAKALSAVLLFRTLTFWLPVPFGWLSMNYLQRIDAL
jgi:glycosyltransferase 2 family protein